MVLLFFCLAVAIGRRNVSKQGTFAALIQTCWDQVVLRWAIITKEI